MSVQALSWVMRRHGVSPVEKLVLFALANYANADGEAWPSIASIVAVTELSRRSVFNALARLEATGLIRRLDPAGNRRSTTYKLALQDVHRIGAPDAPTQVQDVHRIGAPDAPTQVQDVHLIGAPDAPDPKGNRQVEPSGKEPPSPDANEFASRILSILCADQFLLPAARSQIDLWHQLGADNEMIVTICRELAARKGWRWRGFNYVTKVMEGEVKARGYRSEPDEFGIPVPVPRPRNWDDFPPWRRWYTVDHLAWQRAGEVGPQPDAWAYERAGGRPPSAQAPPILTASAEG